MTHFDYLWIILGFVLFLYAVGAKFKLGAYNIGFQTENGKPLPCWDRLVAGAVGIIPLSLGMYKAVSNVIGSSSGILPWASAAAITVPTVAYLLALLLHDWKQDAKWTYRTLLVVIATPLVFLVFLYSC